MGTNLAGNEMKATRKQKKIKQNETIRMHEQENENKKERSGGRRKSKKRYRIRKFPIWLRLIVVFLLFILALIAGLMVGYGVLGDGDPFDVLDKQTWLHIRDIIYKE